MASCQVRSNTAVSKISSSHPYLVTHRLKINPFSIKTQCVKREALYVLRFTHFYQPIVKIIASPASYSNTPTLTTTQTPRSPHFSVTSFQLSVFSTNLQSFDSRPRVAAQDKSHGLGPSISCCRHPFPKKKRHTWKMQRLFR